MTRFLSSQRVVLFIFDLKRRDWFFSEGLLIEKIVAPHGVIDGKENLSFTFIWLTLVSTENEDEDDFEAAFAKEVEGIKAMSEKKERDFQQVGCPRKH